MKKFLKATGVAVAILGYAGLVGINICTGNWVVAVGMMMAAGTFGSILA